MNLEQLLIGFQKHHKYIGAADEKIIDYYNWRQRTNGEWNETHISGDHTTIFDYPNVIKIAEHINNKNW